MTIHHELRRTGRKMAFLDLDIGSPFWAHGRLWVRTNGTTGTVLRSAPNTRQDPLGTTPSACNFLIDGTTYPSRRYGFPDNDRCEEVEAVDVVLDSDRAVESELARDAMREAIAWRICAFLLIAAVIAARVMGAG